MQKAEPYLLEHGLTPSDLPKAVLVHEGLGIGLLAGVWAACYGVQPTKRFVAAYDRDLMERTMIRADALVNKLPVFVTARTDPQRLLVRVWSRRASLGVDRLHGRCQSPSLFSCATHSDLSPFLSSYG
jgi:hypothetical protein